MKKAAIIVLPFVAAFLVFLGVQYYANQTDSKGALQVTSVPSGAVYLDNKYLGKTPLCNCSPTSMLHSGIHTLKIVPSDNSLQTFEQQITISPNVLTVVDRTFGPTGFSEGSIITLVPEANSTDPPTMIVLTSPDNASVAIDSNPVGTAPLQTAAVTESDHEIKVTKDGYREKVLRVHAVTGYKLLVKVFLGVSPTNLNPSPGVTPVSSPTLASHKVVILQTPTGFLRVRAAADINSAEVAEVKPGESYQLLSQVSGWYEIRLNNGQSGWVSSNYAKLQ